MTWVQVPWDQVNKGGIETIREVRSIFIREDARAYGHDEDNKGDKKVRQVFEITMLCVIKCPCLFLLPMYFYFYV